MFQNKILPVVSLGVGVVIGVKYREWINLSRKHYDYLPTVSAATSSTNKPSLTDTAVALTMSPSKRSAEIMKYGYPGSDVRTYDNFVLSYDRRNRNAHWVFEHLTPDLLNIKDTDRNKSTFLEDSAIHYLFRSTNDDYKGSGYDRGHLAAARNHRHSQRALDQTFFLTNVAPQSGVFSTCPRRKGKTDHSAIAVRLEFFLRVQGEKERQIIQYCCQAGVFSTCPRRKGKTDHSAIAVRLEFFLRVQGEKERQIIQYCCQAGVFSTCPRRKGKTDHSGFFYVSKEKGILIV
ncbi:hypothetical protein ACJMK2_039811 [Sinanodonta woodiana]|uniref:Endonuclease n=1 Tax=Sinanodonta woodiana TaxID=1069815 RepID=A0ABD3WD51_SINWO